MADKRLRIYDNELRQVIFAELYQRYSEPKAQRRAMTIMEAAIQCLSKQGFDGVTLEMIAREASVTRPLIRHYFSNLDELLQTSIKYIRLLFQKVAIDAMVKAKQPDEMLANYIDSCFFWLENFRTHALVWLAFMHRCGRSKKARELNTAAVRTGEDRIQALLEKGRQDGVFHFSDPVMAAKMVQSAITGGLLTYISEDLLDSRKYADEIRRLCFHVLQA